MKITEAQLRQLTKRVRTGNATASGARTVAKAPNSAPTYRSKLEAAYATYLDGLKKAGDIQSISYEPITIRVAEGVRYTPDFLVITPDGSLTFHEVKGYTKGLMASKGMVKVKVAASQWPCWKFVIVTRNRGAWECREL